VFLDLVRAGSGPPELKAGSFSQFFPLGGQNWTEFGFGRKEVTQGGASGCPPGGNRGVKNRVKSPKKGQALGNGLHEPWGTNGGKTGAPKKGGAKKGYKLMGGPGRDGKMVAKFGARR